MTCLYEATMVDLIRALMQIVKYKFWFKGGPIGKGPHHSSLKVVCKVR